MNSNRGWKIYHKMPRDIQDLMSVHLMNNTKEYFRTHVSPYLIKKAKKKEDIRYIINYYKNKYKILRNDYIYNLLERDVLGLLRFIFEEKKDFENFVNKIFNDKIDIIQEKYKSEIVVNKILIKLSYIHLDLFKKMNTL
tara:strand:+ start:597 stop:1013 length:417 start_codon:yes stop_codon:yes gene_type:complete